MAGLIIINERASWSVATWVWANVTRLMREHISKDEYPKFVSLLNEDENPLLCLALDDLSEKERSVFWDALKKAYQQAKAAGPDSFHSPEFYPGFIDRFKELLDMEAASMVS